MCDERTYRESMEHLERSGKLTRRDFGTLSAGAGLAVLLPPVANAQEVTESEVDVQTPDGIADCYFVRPSAGAHAGVIIWPDIMSLRPAFRQMGRRLAESGYSVLVVNPFYRVARAPVVPVGATMAQDETRATVFPLAATLSAQTNISDAHAFVDFLDSQPSVDTSRKIGTMGYCMGGPITMRTAAAVPERIGAGASFHGGGLVTEALDSPHLLIPNMDAQYLFAIAANDDADEPDVKDVLRERFAEAGLAAEIEVYEDTLHGWCPPDSHVYSEPQAERAWSRMLALFDTALA